MKNFGLNYVNDGFINVSWINREIDDEAILFSLILETKTDGTLSDYFSISEEIMPAEAYDLNDEFLALSLDFEKEPIKVFTAKPNYQNFSWSGIFPEPKQIQKLISQPICYQATEFIFIN